MSNCASPLAAGAACTLQLTATPAATGTRTATLTLPANTASGSVTLPLSVTGGSPSAGPVTLSTSELAWTIAGAWQDLTISNHGSTELHFNGITSSDPSFTLVANSCGTVLAAQSLCTISVQSTGTGVTESYFDQRFSGTLTIVDDAAAGNQTVALSSDNTLTVNVPTFPSTTVGSAATASAGVTGTSHNDQANFTSSITGTNASEFAGVANSQSGTAKMPGCMNTSSPPSSEFCSYSMTFAPTGTGADGAAD